MTNEREWMTWKKKAQAAVKTCIEAKNFRERYKITKCLANKNLAQTIKSKSGELICVAQLHVMPGQNILKTSSISNLSKILTATNKITTAARIILSEMSSIPELTYSLLLF